MRLKSMLRLRVHAAVIVSLITGIAMGAEAPADEPGTTSDRLDEVVVTAEKRAENLQEVPIAVTAFTAQALQDKGIQNVSDLTRLTPNANFDTASPFGGSNLVLSASIRGIGQDDFAFNLDPGVGVYVDGIYLARTVGANADLLDVDRVEILKGPQGTLFGRNTIGGAINILTRMPGDDYAFEGEVTGGSFDRHDIQATADIPLSDTVLSTISFAALDRDGYQRRIPYPSAVPYVSDPPSAFHEAGNSVYGTLGGEDQDTIRAKLLWKAADDIQVIAALDWTHVREAAVPETLLDTVTNIAAPGAALGAFYNFCLEGIPVPSLAACGPRGPGLSQTIGNTGNGALLAGGNAGVSNGNPGLFGTGAPGPGHRLLYGNQFITGNIDTSYASGPDFDRMDAYGGGVTLDWTPEPDVELKLISGYRRLDWTVGVDASGAPIHMLDLSFGEGQHQVSEELQLIGKLWDGRLRYSNGLYYFNEGGFIHDYVTFDEGLLQVDGPNYLETSSYAGYGHADYDLTPDLTLVLGARYSYDHKTFLGEQHDLNAFSYKASGCYPVSAACAVLLGYPVPDNPLQYMPAGTSTEDFYLFTPTAGVQWQIAPDAMAYATYSKGYKDGGWTTRLTNPLKYFPKFGPEKAETYEIGSKAEFLDHRLSLDLAGFYTAYDGIQLNFQEGNSPTLKNAGNATILGAEAESRWLIGDGLQLAASAGYIDAYYTTLAAGINQGQACVQPYQPCLTLGTKLPKTPKFKFSLGPEYAMALPNEAVLRLGIDYTHTSSMFNDALDNALLRRPDTEMLDASLTYVSPDDRYEIVAGGTNLLSDRFLVTGNANATAGVIYGTYNPPAEWYLTLRIKLAPAKPSPSFTPAP